MHQLDQADDPLPMIESHLRRLEGIVARQVSLVTKLEKDGEVAMAERAKKVLTSFEERLEQLELAREHLRFRRELRGVRS